MPDTAEEILAAGKADMVQMARPLLADAFGSVKLQPIVLMKLILALPVTKRV